MATIGGRQFRAGAASLAAVSSATGLHHTSLLRFVRGDRTLTLDTAEKLMAYFGIEAQKKGGE